MLGRTVIIDRKFYDKTLKVGDKVMMLFASALRDPRVFKKPNHQSKMVGTQNQVFEYKSVLNLYAWSSHNILSNIHAWKIA